MAIFNSRRLKSLPRILRLATLLVAAFFGMASLTHGTQVVFDLPDTVECRDATPPDFAAAHPALKVIEGKLRISARIVAGAESEIVDYLYVISSPDKMLRFQDYLPNTTLESAVCEDHIEITDTTEDTKALDADARVGYRGIGLGLTKNKGAKKTESNHYKQIVPKALVLSSGTTDREHGVFFRLRPSNGATLEGAKEFTFLATVPKTWRGDWFTISCAARAKKKSLFSTSVVPAGLEQSQIGIYLVGDTEANALTRELRQVQESHSAVLAAHLAKDADGLLDTMYAAVSTQAISVNTSLCGLFKGSKSDGGHVQTRYKLDPDRLRMLEAQKAVVDVQDRLSRLAR
jgi:hypothetical protein